MGAVLERAVSVRQMAPDDAGFLERLAARAFGEFNRNAGAQTLGLTERPGTETHLAVRGGERIGFVVVELAPGAAWVQAIAVVASERGRGVGTLLMGLAVRHARKAGAVRLRLTTAQANVEALELFLKAGFVIERRLPRYYAGGQDACVLGRSL